MNTHIRNADARRFWEARFAYHSARLSTRDFTTNYCCAASICADDDIGRWAERFADADTLDDIEVNRARRAAGNTSEEGA